MTSKLTDNASLGELMTTLESVQNDLQVGKNNIANILGSPFTGNDKLDTTKNTLNSIRSTFVSNLNKKGVSTVSNTPFKILAENVGKIEQGNMNVPIWYKPKNILITAASDSYIRNDNYAAAIGEEVFFFIKYDKYTMYFRKYNTITNSLTSLASPVYNTSFLLVSYNDEIYQIGGLSGSTALNTCKKYNAKTLTWSSLPNMGANRFGAGGEAYKNQIHVFYGKKNTTDSVAVNTSEYFLVDTNTWTNKGNLQLSKYAGYTCAKGSNNFVVYGLSDPGNVYSVIIANYSPTAGTISGRYGTSGSFVVPIKNYLLLGNYDYYSSGKYTTIAFGENGRIFERSLESLRIPSSYDIKAVSIEDKFVYYCLDGNVICFIPEL
ncbi:kelch repeat-containing protein [Clostridioides difficile]|nr:kelch repeat-containing protein [Clostridioides difficile]MDI6389340.1 kelch repeat-containing protein [Clostridioides difficile]